TKSACAMDCAKPREKMIGGHCRARQLSGSSHIRSSVMYSVLAAPKMNRRKHFQGCLKRVSNPAHSAPRVQLWCSSGERSATSPSALPPTKVKLDGARCGHPPWLCNHSFTQRSGRGNATSMICGNGGWRCACHGISPGAIRPCGPYSGDKVDEAV